MTAHSRLPASGTKRWMACPGSLAYEERYGTADQGSIHAKMGTAAHALGERCLREGSEPVAYEGRLIKVFNDGSTSILRKNAKLAVEQARDTLDVFEIDADMYEAVTKFVNYVRRRCIELELTDSETNVATLVKTGIVRLETRVDPLPERDDTGGTADVIIDAWPEILEVVDYKHGSGVFVPVENNPQLMTYAAGSLRTAGAGDYAHVRYTIVQPRHIKTPPSGVMFEETSSDEILAWADGPLNDAAKRVDEAAENVEHGADLNTLFADGYISVGDGEHCTFCGLLSACPAVRTRAQETAQADFDNEPEELDEGTPGPNRLAELLPWVPLLDKWLRAIEADAERLLLSGGKVAGYKLVRGRANRKYRSDMTADQMADALVEKFDLDRAALFRKPDLLPMGKVEKMIEPGRRAEYAEEFLEKPEGKLTIAAESDPRDAVAVNPADDFEGVEK